MKNFIDIFKSIEKGPRLYFSLQIDKIDTDNNYYSNTCGYSLSEIRFALKEMQAKFDAALYADDTIKIYITAQVGKASVYERTISIYLK